MRKLIVVLTVVMMMLIAAAPAVAHVHVRNPSDECSGGKNPLGLVNPAGKEVPSTPQAEDSPAPTKCANNR